LIIFNGTHLWFYTEVQKLSRLLYDFERIVRQIFVNRSEYLIMQKIILFSMYLAKLYLQLSSSLYRQIIPDEALTRMIKWTTDNYVSDAA
jgi:hypothetical protein